MVLNVHVYIRVKWLTKFGHENGKKQGVNWEHHAQAITLFRQSEGANCAGNLERRKNRQPTRLRIWGASQLAVSLEETGPGKSPPTVRGREQGRAGSPGRTRAPGERTVPRDWPVYPPQ